MIEKKETETSKSFENIFDVVLGIWNKTSHNLRLQKGNKKRNENKIKIVNEPDIIMKNVNDGADQGEKKISRQNEIFRTGFILDLWFERSQINAKSTDRHAQWTFFFLARGAAFFPVLPQYTAFQVWERKRKKKKRKKNTTCWILLTRVSLSLNRRRFTTENAFTP